jgi:DNA-binding response OmpR family regulator
MASDRKKAMVAGCDDYYTKPVDFESLVRSLETFLEARNRRARPANAVPAGIPPSVGRNPAALRRDPQC